MAPDVTRPDATRTVLDDTRTAPDDTRTAPDDTRTALSTPSAVGMFSLLCEALPMLGMVR